jgi:hypothetical protein
MKVIYCTRALYRVWEGRSESFWSGQATAARKYTFLIGAHESQLLCAFRHVLFQLIFVGFSARVQSPIHLLSVLRPDPPQIHRTKYRDT